jgi:cell division protein FtsB
MKNLEEEQRKMRERMAGLKPTRAAIKPRAKSGKVESSQPVGLNALQKRIADLKAENASLKLQLAKLGDPPRRQPTSSDLSDTERRHLFMKYSNVRRY